MSFIKYEMQYINKMVVKNLNSDSMGEFIHVLVLYDKKTIQR